MKRPRKGFERWLSPEAQQPDGSLWLPENAAPRTRARRGKRPRVVRHAEPARDPFTSMERQFLRSRLASIERSKDGLAAGLGLRGLANCGGMPDRYALPPALRGLLDRGLLLLAVGPRGPRCVFTEAGTAALRELFLRQPTDFRVLFPRLHRELGLAHLLDPP